MLSYPRKAPPGSSSLMWSEDSDSVDLPPAELLATFDAVDGARSIISAHNPRASVAGCKYFYLDWNCDL